MKQTLPTGKGRLSGFIRDLDQRVKRLEPRQTPGMLTSIDPTGVNQRPKNLLSGNASKKSSTLPRYR